MVREREKKRVSSESGGRVERGRRKRERDRGGGDGKRIERSAKFFVRILQVHVAIPYWVLHSHSG